ncbi:MAG: hypothetical protein AMS14_06185 [Planctomycetes bacterium DG_20]|nr:MAG: hypothetical protein AMS14_06185 [Planctomycetes bacterium DG_20]
MGPALASVDTDGGVPYDTFIGPRLLPDIKNLRAASIWTYDQDQPAIAVSSDENYVYVAGLGVGAAGSKQDPPKVLPCVFRVDVEKRGPAEVFVGNLDTAGKTEAALAAPLLPHASPTAQPASPRGIAAAQRKGREGRSNRRFARPLADPAGPSRRRRDAGL